ncbi:MAG: hypothetical protein AAF335_05160 [Bacteroidota bacterium]
MDRHLIPSFIRLGLRLFYFLNMLSLNAATLPELRANKVLQKEFSDDSAYLHLYGLYYRAIENGLKVKDRLSYTYLVTGLDLTAPENSDFTCKIDLFLQESGYLEDEVLGMEALEVYIGMRENQYPYLVDGYVRRIAVEHERTNLYDYTPIVEVIRSFYVDRAIHAFYADHFDNYKTITRIFKDAVLRWAVIDQQWKFIAECFQKELKNDPENLDKDMILLSRQGKGKYFARYIQLMYKKHKKANDLEKSEEYATLFDRITRKKVLF